MPESANQEGDLPLLGIDFVFEMGMKKIEEQLKEVKALDVKIAVLFGFLGAALVALLTLVFTAEPSAIKALIGWPSKVCLPLGVVFTGLAIGYSFRAFQIIQYYAIPSFRDLYRWANEDPKRTKLAFLSTLLAAVEGNSQRLEDKQVYITRATWCAALGFLSFLLGKMEMGAQLLF